MGRFYNLSLLVYLIDLGFVSFMTAARVWFVLCFILCLSTYIIGFRDDCHNSNGTSWDDGGLLIRFPYIPPSPTTTRVSLYTLFIPYGLWTFHLFLELLALGTIYIPLWLLPH